MIQAAWTLLLWLEALVFALGALVILLALASAGTVDLLRGRRQ